MTSYIEGMNQRAGQLLGLLYDFRNNLNFSGSPSVNLRSIMLFNKKKANLSDNQVMGTQPAT